MVPGKRRWKWDKQLWPSTGKKGSVLAEVSRLLQSWKGSSRSLTAKCLHLLCNISDQGPVIKAFRSGELKVVNW